MELVPSMRLAAFREAASTARLMAIEHGSTTGVARSEDGWWQVLVPRSVAQASNPLEWDDDRFEYEWADDEADSYAEEVRAETRAELSADWDDWCRSDEQGWFYAD